MATSVPSAVMMAAHDPKVASTTALERVMFYSDDIHPDEVRMVAEELERRGVEDYVSHDEYINEYL